MFRITRKLFGDLAIWMVIFGVLIGGTFPFLILLLGVPGEYALTPSFFVSTLIAGTLLGYINFIMAIAIVRPRLRMLSDNMKNVSDSIAEAAFKGNWSNCDQEKCSVTINSDDELGRLSNSFNQLLDSVFRFRKMVEAVSGFSTALSCQLELKKVGTNALKLLIQHTQSMAGCLIIKKQDHLEILDSQWLIRPETLINNEVVQRVFGTSEMKLITIPADIKINAVLAEIPPKEVILVPISFKQISLGLLVLATEKTYLPAHHRILELLRTGLGLALNNALTHHDLQRIAAIDVLTGAYNRRFGLQRFSEEYARARRHNDTLGVLMYDLDFFKKVNDTYGHLTGDRVLKESAEAVRSIMRETDIQIRYGGEEFLVILPGTSKKDCAALAERIRSIVENLCIAEKSTEFHVTISIGAVSYPDTNFTDEMELVRKADEALYEAKQRGRNRVVVM